MAPVQLTCPSPGCGEKTDPATEPEIAIQLLQIHVSLVHGIVGRPDKPRRPELKLVGDAVEETDWDYFKFQFSHYKKLMNITEDASIQLLECISPDIHRGLFVAYGSSLNTQDEATLMSNIRSLVVRQRTSMASILAVLKMNRESDQPMVNYISELKTAARLCNFTVKCKCDRNVDFTDHITMYKLVDGVLDRELQEELLANADLTLEKAENMIKESDKLSQEFMMEDNENKKDDTAGILLSKEHCHSNQSTSQTTSSFERPPSTSRVDIIPVNMNLCQSSYQEIHPKVDLNKDRDFNNRQKEKEKDIKRNRNEKEKEKQRSRSRSRDRYEKRDNKHKHRYESLEDRKHHRNGQSKDRKGDRDSKIERNNRDSKDEHRDKRVERNLKDSREESGHRDRKVEKDHSGRDNRERKDERDSWGRKDETYNRDRKDERDSRNKKHERESTDRKDERDSRDRKEERDNKYRKDERDDRDKRENDKRKEISNESSTINCERGENGSKDKRDESGNNKSNYDQGSKIGKRKKDYTDVRRTGDSLHGTDNSIENFDPQGKSSSKQCDYRNDNSIPGPSRDYNGDHPDIESPDTSESLEHSKDDHPEVESPDTSESSEHSHQEGIDAGFSVSEDVELSIIGMNNQAAIEQLIVQKNIRARSVLLRSKSEQEWFFFMLPPEIQLYIFDLISTKELSILAQTCKALDNLVNEVFVLKVILPLSKETQKQLDGRFVLDVTSSFPLRIWKKGEYLGMVKKMKLAKLKRIKFNGKNFGVKREQTKITPYGNCVESYHGLHDPYLDALEHYISHGINLESIDILIDNSVRISHLINTIATFPRLREVTLRSTGTGNDLQSDPDENPSMTMNKLIENLLKNQAITKLTLKGFCRPWGTKSGRCPDTNYAFVIKSKSLEKLRIEHNKCFDIGNIEAENLREIDMEIGFYTPSMDRLAPLLAVGCPKLERFNKLSIKKLKEDGEDWLEELRQYKMKWEDHFAELSEEE